MQHSVDSQAGGLIKFYQGFISLLRFCIAHIKKHLLLFISCILITFAALYLKFNIGGKDHYDISFTVSYEELVRKIYGDRLTKINTLINHKDYDKLKSYLNVDEATLKELISVHGKNILGEDLTEDMNLERVPFIITMQVKDTNSVIALQNGIVNYLETGTPYLVSRKALKMEEVDKEIAFIDAQLAMMDSLKRKYNSASFGNMDASNTLEGADKMAGSVYSFSYSLYKRKQELQRKKQMPNNLQIIDDAVVPQKDNKPILLILAGGLLGGIILYALIAGILIPVFRKEP